MWMHLLVHLFQSTLLQEERPQDNMVMQIGKMISIHAPTRGATCQPYTPSHSCLISIHAPTRGATPLDEFMRNATLISIHAPTRGATLEYVYSKGKKLFQSTLLQEERRGWKLSDIKELVISIHAPTRGATEPITLYDVPKRISIHAPTRGATPHVHLAQTLT